MDREKRVPNEADVSKAMCTVPKRMLALRLRETEVPVPFSNVTNSVLPQRLEELEDASRGETLE